MAKDVFISHSSKDAKLAVTICRALEDRGIGCWIAPRDISPGENFQEAIVRAIRQAKSMVLVFSSNTNDSTEVKKELVLASQNRLAVIPLRIEDVVPSEAFAYELSTRQWIDLFHDWETAVSQVGDQIRGLLGTPGAPLATVPAAPAKRGAMPTKPLIAAGAVVVVLAALGGMYALTRGPTPLPAPTPAPSQPAPSQTAARGDLVFWNSIKSETTAAPFEAYLKQFPNGQFVALARLKIDELKPQAGTGPYAAVFTTCPAAHDSARGDALPTEINARMRIGNALIGCATESWQGHEYANGKKQLDAAMEIFTQLITEAPKRGEFVGDLALAHERYGRILRAEGDLAGAIRESRQDISLRTENLQKFPKNADTKAAIAMSEFILAGILKQAGDNDAAKAAYGRCADLRKEAIAGDSTAPFLQGPLKTCESALLQFDPAAPTKGANP